MRRWMDGWGQCMVECKPLHQGRNMEHGARGRGLHQGWFHHVQCVKTATHRAAGMWLVCLLVSVPCEHVRPDGNPCTLHPPHTTLSNHSSTCRVTPQAAVHPPSPVTPPPPPGDPPSAAPCRRRTPPLLPRCRARPSRGTRCACCRCRRRPAGCRAL